MASTDYTGRMVDLFIFQGAEEFGDQRIDSGWGDVGELTTGIQKLAQTWTIMFLTDSGSVMNEPNRGTAFLNSMRFGRIRVDEDIPAEFAIAAARIFQQMAQDSANADIADDELLDEAILLEYGIDYAQALLWLKVRLVSLAGDERVIYLPISVPIH